MRIDEVNSVQDLGEWLHEIGWRSPCDAQWEKISELFDYIEFLRTKSELNNKISHTEFSDPLPMIKLLVSVSDE